MILLVGRKSARSGRCLIFPIAANGIMHTALPLLAS
jgi:hypothetical protein